MQLLDNYTPLQEIYSISLSLESLLSTGFASDEEETRANLIDPAYVLSKLLAEKISDFEKEMRKAAKAS